MAKKKAKKKAKAKKKKKHEARIREHRRAYARRCFFNNTTRDLTTDMTENGAEPGRVRTTGIERQGHDERRTQERLEEAA